jgi:hypothetical protein
MTDTTVAKHEKIRRKYKFYMDVRKKLIALMVICSIGCSLAGVAIAVTHSIALGFVIGTVALFSFIVPMIIIERIWVMVNYKTYIDYINSL